jgi:hypothetical protein
MLFVAQRSKLRISWLTAELTNGDHQMDTRTSLSIVKKNKKKNRLSPISLLCLPSEKERTERED